MWTAYWTAALWFQLVALAYNFPSIFKDAEKNGKISSELLNAVEVACDALGEAPILSLRASLCLQGARLKYRVMTWIINLAHTLWIVLTWKMLRTDHLLQITRSLKIPRMGTLDLRGMDE